MKYKQLTCAHCGKTKRNHGLLGKIYRDGWHDLVKEGYCPTGRTIWKPNP